MSLSLLLMIVSIGIADLPVWRSPMISSRWPRPIGIMASIALMPVSTGSSTGWRWTTPGALNSAGRVSSVSISPLPSSGRPSGSTIRPSRPSPTGISSRLPERLTSSPSSILSHSPKSTAPTLSDSRFSARPVTSCGNSSISSDAQLSSPWMRAMPSATERTVPTSERSAPPSSMPSMRSLRMLVISSGLICIRQSFLGGSRHFLTESFEAPAHAGVHHHVSDGGDEPAYYVGIDVSVQIDPLTGLFLDPAADALNQLVIERCGTRDAYLQELVLLAPQVVELAADAKDRGNAMPLGAELQEVEEVLVRTLDDLVDAVLLLLRREVRREEEHL